VPPVGQSNPASCWVTAPSFCGNLPSGLLSVCPKKSANVFVVWLARAQVLGGDVSDLTQYPSLYRMIVNLVRAEIKRIVFSRVIFRRM